MEDLWNSILDNILEAMKNQGITQTQLAELCGWTSGNISRYFTGKNVPSLDNLQKIADALDISIVRLVDIKGEIPEPTNEEILNILRQRLKKSK